jgi:hypothetical protein
MSHLGILFHYPKPAVRDQMRTDFLKVAEVMNRQPGVQAETYEEPQTGALVAVTRYEDRADVEAGFRSVAEAGIQVEYDADAEEQPRVRHLLMRIQ